jgi:nucleotide-binding universal stress UspA family protein
MRFLSDNKDEMLRSAVTDEDIELLLSGAIPEGGELSLLVPVIRMLRADGARLPSESDSRQVAAAAAELARSSRAAAELSTRAAPPIRPSWSHLVPRFIGALAALLVFTAGGVAIAADGSAPGDALYGIDRALERLGIGSGRAEERIDEAARLAGLGRAQEALAHVAEALDEAEQDGEDVADLTQAREALDEAANVVPVTEDAGARAVQQRVETLLEFIKENVHKDMGVDGREFGQEVARLARLIALNEENGQDGDSDTTNSTTATTVVSQPDSGTGNENSGNGSGNENGNGNGGNGNGPPPDSPSETAPGRGNRP